MKEKLAWWILTVLIFLIPVMVPAQQSDEPVDELYERARQAAFDEENYDRARELAYRALERSPAYYEIRVFVGRMYAWEGKYDRARRELKKVLERDVGNRQAFMALIDVEHWSGNYEKALEWVEQAFEFYSRDREFMLARAKILRVWGEYAKAEQVYRRILEEHGESKEVRQGIRSMKLQQMKYKATLSHQYDHFLGATDPWKFWEFRLNRQTEIGPVIGRVQHANRFSTRGVQFKLDAYPSLYEGLYAYASAGFSRASIYPRYRFALSLYKSLPSAFELEGGARYMDFSSTRTTFYILSLSKYHKNYLFSAGTYLVPDSKGSSQSFVLRVRRYLGSPEAYAEIYAGTGTAAADIEFVEDVQRRDSWSVRLIGQYPLTRRINMGGIAGFESEKLTNNTRDRYSFKLSLSYRF